MKKLLTGLILLGLVIVMTATNAITYKVYLPLIIQNEIIKYEWHTCKWELDDAGGRAAGEVIVWMLIAYHPDGHVKLTQFYDMYEPPTYKWTYYKWYAKPYKKPWWSIKPYELNLLWIAPVGNNKNWNTTFVESISAWEAVTYISGSVGYTLNSVAFKKGHYRYPIDCIKIAHISYPYPYPEP